MSYTAPAGNAVNLQFGSGYSAPAGNALVLQNTSPAANRWDPSYAPSPLALSNSNQRLTLPAGNSSVTKTARGVGGRSTGKWYCEIKFVNIIDGTDTVSGAGIAADTFSFSGANLAAGTSSNEAVGVWPDSTGTTNRIYRNGTFITGVGIADLNDGKTLMLALDADARKLWVGVDGVWHNSGSPAAGTNATVDSTYLAAGKTWYPAASPWSGEAIMDLLADQGECLYAIPSGFSYWDAGASSASAQGDGAAAGTSTPAAVGATRAAATAAAAGTSTAAGSNTSSLQADGASAGAGVATGVGGARFSAIAAAAGVAALSGAGDSTSSGDPYWANVELLIHADSSLVDVSTRHRTLTTSGTVAIDTGTKLFGAGALLVGDNTFSGADDYVNAGSVTLTGDFTLEFATYLGSELAASVSLVTSAGELQVYASNGYGVTLFDMSTEVERILVADPGAGWHRLAWTRSGGVNRLLVDGVPAGTTWTNSATLTVSQIRIGSDATYGGSHYGRYDEIRLTSGVARYTGAYTPATAAFWDDGSGGSSSTVSGDGSASGSGTAAAATAVRFAGAAAAAGVSTVSGDLIERYARGDAAAAGTTTVAGAIADGTVVPGWNPNDAAPASGVWAVSSDGATATATAKGKIRGTAPKNSGKWYFEVVLSTSSVQYCGLGYASDTMSPNAFGNYDLPAVWQQNDGNYHVYGFAFDADTGTVWYHVDGSWPTGSPTDDEQFTETMTAGADIIPVVINQAAGTRSFYGKFTRTSLVYAPPAGFSAIYGFGDTSMVGSAAGTSTVAAAGRPGTATVGAAGGTAANAVTILNGRAGGAAAAGLAGVVGVPGIALQGLGEAGGAGAVSGLVRSIAAAIGAAAGSSTALVDNANYAEGVAAAAGVANLLARLGARTRFEIGPRAFSEDNVQVATKTEPNVVVARTSETATI